MNWEKPTTAAVWIAIDAFLSLAYDAAPPTVVRTRLELLRASRPGEFYAASCFEAAPKVEPIRLDLRLGNRWYPHMKLVIECAPDKTGHLFRSDTHDRHIQPAPGSRDAQAFRELMEKNQLLAARIEAAWEANGLPTFKSYLRQDLARRQSQRPS